MQENLPKSKKIRTRSDTKLNPDSAQGVMGLEITSLLENSKTDESGDSNNGMENVTKIQKNNYESGLIP
ncbi:hypothetical protein GLOIN_2v1828930 [Rhizophagus irregularis DAOM 181602=DAOM 197198]|nr:hypothetical protein GLOIN_2v1828930 [Rhizophagus irregularis DAOM 181602=DAOM 197198]CAG8695009.1 22084_t:CDS:2 [Rhizophagus irregularis]